MKKKSDPLNNSLATEDPAAETQTQNEKVQHEDDSNGKATFFEQLIARLARSRAANIAVPTFDGLQMLNVGDIIKCVAHESYTEIVLVCGSRFMVSRHLKEYQDMLSAFNFFRIHNSILINLRHVRKYVRGEGGYVMMADGQSCEVSRRKKQELLSRLSLVEF